MKRAPKMTEAQCVEIKRALLMTWDAIAPDLLQSKAVFMREKNVYRVNCSRAEVVDVVLDNTYDGFRQCDHPPSPEALAAWKAQSYTFHTKFARSVFTYKTYGY